MLKMTLANTDGSTTTLEADTPEQMQFLVGLHRGEQGKTISLDDGEDDENVIDVDAEVVEAAELDEDFPPPSLHVVAPTPPKIATSVPVTWRERQVIEVLRRHPDGIPSMAIAQRLGRTKAAINGTIGGLGPKDPRRRGLVERVPGRWLWRLTPFGRNAQLFECSVPGHVYGFTYAQRRGASQ